MNDILKLKKKYAQPTSKTVCKVVNQYMSSVDSCAQENELRIAEDQRKIEDLSHELSILKDKLDNDTKVMDEKNQELNTEIEKLNNLKTERNRIVKKNYELERKCHKLRMIKPNIRDQYILDLGMKKFNLYKQLTGIRWHFSALEEATKGFVTDKKKYIHTFCYPKDIQGEELSDLLWKEIELSTEKEVPDDGDKENSSSNTGNN